MFYGKGTVHQIAKSAVLLAIAVGLAFVKFSPFPGPNGGGVFLIGIPVFLCPYFLRLPYALITGFAGVIIADLINGFIAWTWISVVAYGAGLIIIWLFSKLKLIPFLYIVAFIVASAVITLIYYLLELVTFNESIAISDTLNNAIQFAIVIAGATIIYQPLKILKFI